MGDSIAHLKPARDFLRSRAGLPGAAPPSAMGATPRTSLELAPSTSCALTSAGVAASAARSVAATDGAPTEVPTEAELLDKDVPTSASVAELGGAGPLEPERISFFKGLMAFIVSVLYVAGFLCSPPWVWDAVTTGHQAGE